jgi:hypothetical protein
MKNFITKIGLPVIAISYTFLPVASAAQYQPATASQNTVKIAANTGYNKASGFKRMMFGEHYRKEWATAVDVAILDMDTTYGGLTALKAGGGLQTKSLRLAGGNGKEYVLRSVNKDPSKAIVEELRGTFAEDIVQDQISSSNPYAPMVVSSLATAAGIYHTTPRLVYVPRSERLGEFAATYAETLCLLEERPGGNEENNPSVGFSKQVVNSQKMLEKVFTNSDHQVDQLAFLKARLFDMLIGDWDRHEDQWLWASFTEDGKTTYRPIPRDRDQAFSKMDGLIPQMATKKWAIRKVQHFDDHIRDVNGLNSNGSHLDRNFTTRLTLTEWLRVAEELQMSLTDDVIAAAFREMPDAIYNISGKTTVANLKQRRNDLQKYAKAYYRFLSEQLNITGTRGKEIFEVTRLNDDFTQVLVYKADKYDLKREIIYERTFLRSETKEIRLYGLDGDDIFNINGKTKKGIIVRVIGGKGEDHFKDQSIVKQAGQHTKIYDNSENVFETGVETRRYISSDSLKNDYNRRSFRFDWFMPTQNPGYNADDGLFVGAGFIYKKQQFGKAPYGQMHTLGANYAFSTSAYSIWYKGIFKEFAGKADLHLAAKYNSPAYTRNYYGLGNETINDENAEKDYYRLRMSQLSLSSSLHRQLGRKHTISIGNEFQSFKVENTEGRFVSVDYSKLDSSTFGRKKYDRIEAGYQFNTVDNPVYPKKGVKLQVNAAYVQNIKESDRNFVQISTEACVYNSIGRFTLASRTGVAANLSDDYEFFQANSLGGLTNLRGYRRDRFAGKTSVYQNTELRFTISNFNAYITKGVWGVLAFYDNGRVWMPEETSDIWHHGYGGGVWFLPFNKMSITATYGVSKEEKLVSVTAGFLF